MAALAGMFVGLPTVVVGALLTWGSWAMTRRRSQGAHLAATWAPAALVSMGSALLWGQAVWAATTG